MNPKVKFLVIIFTVLALFAFISSGLTRAVVLMKMPREHMALFIEQDALLLDFEIQIYNKYYVTAVQDYFATQPVAIRLMGTMLCALPHGYRLAEFYMNRVWIDSLRYVYEARFGLAL